MFVHVRQGVTYLLIWLVSASLVPPQCLAQQNVSVGGVDTTPPRPPATNSTTVPRGMACSPEWEEVVRRNFLTDGKVFPRNIIEMSKVFCPQFQPSWSVRWGPGGPGDSLPDRLEDDRLEDPNSLDSITCTEAMGDTSHPMSDEEFLRTKFVVVFYLPEQLSKARKHLAEVVALAHALDRVLILPRVGGSTISMVGALPFCAYFDIPRLTEFVRWVTFEWHLQASLRLGKKPSVQYVCLSYKKTNCLRAQQVWLGRLPLLAITHGILWNSENNVRVCVQEADKDCIATEHELRSGKEGTRHLNNADLLVINKGTAATIIKLHHGNYSAAYRSIAYTATLEAKADSILELLGPNCGAMHLRFEWMALQQRGLEGLEHLVTVCGMEGMVFLKRMAKDLGLEKIYVASDFSLATLTPYKMWMGGLNSSSVKSVVEEFKRELPLVTWESLEPSVAALDHGIKGIVDKLVCKKAKTFIAGPKECGGGYSFDSEIVMGRLERKYNPPALRWHHNKATR